MPGEICEGCSGNGIVDDAICRTCKGSGVTGMELLVPDDFYLLLYKLDDGRIVAHGFVTQKPHEFEHKSVCGEILALDSNPDLDCEDYLVIGYSVEDGRIFINIGTPINGAVTTILKMTPEDAIRFSESIYKVSRQLQEKLKGMNS